MASPDSVLQLANDAAGVGTFDLDIATGHLDVNAHLLRMSGIDEADFDHRAETIFGVIHTDDIDEVRARVETAISTGGTYESEYRTTHAGGKDVWVVARGRCLTAPDGTPTRLLGAVWDVTEARQTRERITDALEQLTVGYISMDRNWTMTYANVEASRIAQRPVDRLVGASFWEAFPAALGSPFERAYRSVAETGEPITFDAFYPEPLNAWVDVRAVREHDGVAIYFYDITERREAQAANERAAARASLLAHVTSEITDTLDAEEAVARLAKTVVPMLGDWSVITLVDDFVLGRADGMRDVASWHHEEAKRELVSAYAAARLAAATPQMPLMRAITTNRPVVVQHRAAEVLRNTLRSSEARRLITELDPDCLVVVPLVGRGRTVGVLTLGRDAGNPTITSDELAVANDVAARAGLALDSARLYRQQRNLATSLQLSLLSDPPQPDHMEVVARYVPAAESAQVGGDWYDAFLQADGATTVVIGDVIGHDSAAAASMGQVRTLLRGTAALTGVGPADVLHQLESVMELLQIDCSATTSVMRFEQTQAQLEAGRTTVRWSNAGHPPPMLIDRHGTVSALSCHEVDLQVGMFPDSERHETVFEAERAATLFLYTDGLIERRGQDLEGGLALLEKHLRRHAGRELSDLCDTVLRELLPAHIDDDVAVIAVRLHPQSNPRPPEAGPPIAPDTVPPPRT